MAIKPYTNKELRLMREMLSKGISAETIAKSIGRSKLGMMRKGREIGLSFWPLYYKKQSAKHKYTFEDTAIVKKWAGRKTINEIGAMIGVSGKAMYAKYSKMGIKFTLFNEYHPQCKHSSHDVELIRQLYDEGLNVNEIARKFGISHQMISQYVNYTSRIHYDPELVTT